jgi:hypothetical protein
LKTHCNITLSSTPWSSKWSLSSQISPPNPCIQISCLPSVPHVLPISKLQLFTLSVQYDYGKESIHFRNSVFNTLMVTNVHLSLAVCILERNV